MTNFRTNENNKLFKEKKEKKRKQEECWGFKKIQKKNAGGNIKHYFNVYSAHVPTCNNSTSRTPKKVGSNKGRFELTIQARSKIEPTRPAKQQRPQMCQVDSNYQLSYFTALKTDLFLFMCNFLTKFNPLEHRWVCP